MPVVSVVLELPTYTLENPPGMAAQFVVELGRKKRLHLGPIPGVTSWATGKVNLDILELERKQKKRNMRYIYIYRYMISLNLLLLGAQFF